MTDFRYNEEANTYNDHLVNYAGELGLFKKDLLKLQEILHNQGIDIEDGKFNSLVEKLEDCVIKDFFVEQITKVPNDISVKYNNYKNLILGNYLLHHNRYDNGRNTYMYLKVLDLKTYTYILKDIIDETKNGFIAFDTENLYIAELKGNSWGNFTSSLYTTKIKVINLKSKTFKYIELEDKTDVFVGGFANFYKNNIFYYESQSTGSKISKINLVTKTKLESRFESENYSVENQISFSNNKMIVFSTTKNNVLIIYNCETNKFNEIEVNIEGRVNFAYINNNILNVYSKKNNGDTPYESIENDIFIYQFNINNNKMINSNKISTIGYKSKVFPSIKGNTFKGNTLYCLEELDKDNSRIVILKTIFLPSKYMKEEIK